MLEGKGDGFRVEADVERVQDAAAHRHPEMSLESFGDVWRDQRNGVAASDATTRQRPGEPAAAFESLTPVVPSFAVGDGEPVRVNRRASQQKAEGGQRRKIRRVLVETHFVRICRGHRCVLPELAIFGAHSGAVERLCNLPRIGGESGQSKGKEPMMTDYAETYRRSIEQPEEFWAEAAEAIDWERRWDRVLDASRPPFYRWFAGARLNTCWNALDRHVAAGNGERLALVWDSPVTGQIARFTYREMRDRVARFAGVLAGLGVTTGDRVLIYMPMVPEAAIAMLACARIGAIHSVVFGGFASHELATRIDDAKPVVIVSASCGIEITRVIPYKPLLDAAIAEARSKPQACVVLQRPMCQAELVPGRDHD